MVQWVGCGRCIFETKLKQELRVTVIQSDQQRAMVTLCVCCLKMLQMLRD